MTNFFKNKNSLKEFTLKSEFTDNNESKLDYSFLVQAKHLQVLSIECDRLDKRIMQTLEPRLKEVDLHTVSLSQRSTHSPKSFLNFLDELVNVFEFNPKLKYLNLCMGVKVNT